jgi:hypothetical protein
VPACLLAAVALTTRGREIVVIEFATFVRVFLGC